MTHLTKKKILSYFNNKEKGTAIQVNSVYKYEKPIYLDTLQKIDKNLHVPQNFRYLKQNRDEKLILYVKSILF